MFYRLKKIQQRNCKSDNESMKMKCQNVRTDENKNMEHFNQIFSRLRKRIENPTYVR